MLGLVVGFAARQTLGNMVAGVMLAITQPIRIGDRVTFEEVTGRVDDLTLSYTYIDPGDGDLVVIPNESIVSGTIYNHSTGDRAAPVTVSAWVPADADLGRAERGAEGGRGRRHGARRRVDARGHPARGQGAAGAATAPGSATRRRRCASARRGRCKSAGLLARETDPTAALAQYPFCDDAAPAPASRRRGHGSVAASC